MVSRLISILLVASGLLGPCQPFNLDTRNLVIQDRPAGSCDKECMFGFSVAQHSEGGTPWVLVGAPRAESGQPGVSKGGAVYKCPALSSGGCQIIPFDKSGDTSTPQGKQYDIKSGQWFGAVVQSSGADGTVLACAPRYVWLSRNYNRREPIGTCYTAKNNLGEFLEHSPCRTRKWGYHRQGSCQAGLGAAVSKNGEQIYIGAVGSWYWQGQVFSTNLRQLRNQRKTEEGDPQDDDSYLGYSVTTGEFNGDGDGMDVAVGMPRGANLTGKVVLYNSNLTNLNNLTGTQVGAYFGYCLATADLNGDGLDDIIIGSPMWTDYSIMGKFETGRVYVVYQDKNHRFRRFETLDGENHKARFGMAVASLGDINLDGAASGDSSIGYHDLAVGAPYDGPDGRGAVYIFLGSIDGVLKKPAQVIFARDLNSNLRTFGWSLSGGMDLDQNKYPDLLIGAYESGHTVHMRAAPVVHITAEISFDRTSKQINLDDTACTLKDRRTRVPCVPVSISLRYTGVGVPNKLEFNLEYVLDAKKEKQKRMHFIDDEGESVRTTKIEMLKERAFKDKFKVYLLGPNIKDKLTSLDIQVRYSLGSSAGVGVELTPVLGHGDHVASDSINIQKECGSDNICIPDLSIKTRDVSSYLMGSGDKLEIQTDISNRGEDAFNALLEVQIPRGVSYVNANTGETGVSILCSPPSVRNNNTLQCEVGNPLRAGAQVTTSIILQPSTEGFDEPISEFSFSILARSSNPEKGDDDRDNMATFSVPIRVETDFRVTGLSTPPQVEYNISVPLPDKYEFEEDIGEVVTHVYDVKNKGPSSISEAEVYILWPSFNDYGDHLLYLLGFDYDNTRAKCESVKNLNPLSLKTIGSQGYYSSAQAGGGAGGAGGTGGAGAGEGGRGYYRETSSSQSQSTYVQESSGARTGGFRNEDEDEEDEYLPGPASSNRYESTYTKTISQGGQENSFGVRPPVVADGAEETRLFDTQGRPLENTKSLDSSQQSISSSSSTNYNIVSTENKDESSAQGNNFVYSGWRMLPNGTYIRVYDNKKNTEKTSYSGDSSVSRQSGVGSSSQEVRLTSNGGSSEEESTGRINYGSNSAASGSGQYDSSNSNRGNLDLENSGWIKLPDGTWSRQSSSQTSQTISRESSYSGGSSGGSYSGGSSSGSYSGGNSGGSYSGGSSGGYISGGRSGGSYSGGSAGGSYSGSVSESSGASSSRGGGGGRGAESINLGESETLNTIFNAARGPGDYHGTMSKTELEREAGGAVFNRGVGTEARQQVDNTEYRGSGYVSGADGVVGGAGYNSRTGSDTMTQYRGSGSSSYEDETENAGSSYTGEGEDYVTTVRGRWVWSEEEKKWKWEDKGGIQQQNVDQSHSDSGSNDSGWTILPNGTYVRKMSTWSSQSSGYNSNSGQGYSGAGQGYSGSGQGYSGAGQGYSGAVRGSNQGYFEAGSIGASNSGETLGGDSGSSDSGWVLLANGTYVRKQNTWSSSSDSSFRAGVGSGIVVPQDQFGDEGGNTTGWIRQADGTMVKKSSSWASWSSSSSGELENDHLQSIQRQLEQRAKSKLNKLPGNVEPGFESQYNLRSHRSTNSRPKRSLAEFQSELSGCDPRKCTIIKCTIGPLEKDEGVIFKVRSRLFTETQIKNYAEKVQISSKLLTRVTKLPFYVQEEMLAFQSQTVTTTVIPSEPGEVETPWWVWLLAALAGILLLALITYCLYKCGFFKRRRPDDSPEAEPLNGRNGY